MTDTRSSTIRTYMQALGDADYETIVYDTHSVRTEHGDKYQQLVNQE